MGLHSLAEAGAPELLERAANEVVERSLAKGVLHDHGAVDVEGALFTAAGVNPALLHGDADDDSLLPSIKVPLVLGILELIELTVGENVATWNDAPERTTQDVADTLRRLADEIAIAIT
jgi:hypothetical protein